jgi:RNA recognition motif-containing protein
VKDGYAFIHYRDQDSVYAAVDELHKTNIFGTGINNVEVSTSKIARQPRRNISRRRSN